MTESWFAVTFDSGARLTGRCDAAGCHVLEAQSASGDIHTTTFEQWEREPGGVLTAIFDSVSGGRPQDQYTDDYDWETVCDVVPSGRQLRVPSRRQTSGTAELIDYVRVTDADGDELVYWVSDEWAEDPQLVVGAMIGAALDGNLGEV